MRAAVLRAMGQVEVVEVPDPAIVDPADAIVRVLVAAICGSDLWPYRGVEAFTPGDRLGHEWVGVVEEVGREVSRLRAGDVVVAPFAFSDGTCPACRAGLFTSCPRGGFWGGANDGGQAEALRVPFADATLVRIESDPDAQRLPAFLTLADVMATGHHANILAGVSTGTDVVVVGDGAVGLCAVLAASRLGAERVVSVVRHPRRGVLAQRWGATEIVHDTGDSGESIREVLTLAEGGVPAVLECVGTQDAMDVAVGVARPGATIGSVGVPNGVSKIDLYRLFRANVGLRAGVAPARRYLPDLLRDVLDGVLDPSPVLDVEVSLEDIAVGYQAMDERRATKVLVRVS